MDRADRFWSALLELEIDAVAPTRHYLHCAGTILALVDPSEHGRKHRPNPDLIYVRVRDLEAAYERARQAGYRVIAEEPEGIETQSWGERSFYGLDPCGNPFCFVDESTLFTGSK